MESGFLVESATNEGVEGWQGGLDLLLNVSELSSLDSEQSAEQSAEQSPQESYSPVYDMGAYQGYTMLDFGILYGGGMGAGFAVAVCVALAAWAVTSAISILKKGGSV